MLEGIDLGFNENHMIYSACRDCSCFREFCFEGNRGFCCSEGKVENYFIPFEYPTLDKEGRRHAIEKYQENPLPDDCQFHTQCSMLGFMEDDTMVDDIASEGYDLEETTVGKLDLSDPVFGKALERDASLAKWCNDVKDAIAIVLKRDGVIHGFAFLTVEKDYDYSWILPAPPRKHYFQNGDSRLGIRQLYADDDIHNAKRVLLSMAFLKACSEDVDEVYAISYNDTYEMYHNSGFKHVGYMLGGNGGDDESGAIVVVKKLDDLEAGK